MCGIVGLVGKEGAVQDVLDGLRRLEYRGYDSAGLAVLVDGRLQTIRSAGKVASLAEKIAAHPSLTAAALAIGHTRWATHGAPTEKNAHPHTDCKNSIAVVHNGIIENYQQLRDQLIKRGHRFSSQTDSEVIAHLIEENIAKGLAAAVRRAVAALRGTFAFAVIAAAEADAIYATRRESPLVIGLAPGFSLLASDPLPLLAHTKRLIYLADGDVARLRADGVKITDAGGRAKPAAVQALDWDAGRAEKDGYEHFMLKEIFEQPWSLRQALRDRIDLARQTVILDELGKLRRWRSFNKVVILGCGTAWHAGLVGRNMIERTTRLPVQVDYAAEFRYRDPIVDKKTLAIAISQSGETADTIGAVREAKARGAFTLGVINVPGSTLARCCDAMLLTRCGPEIGVASTKAFTAQIAVLYLLAIGWGRLLGKLSADESKRRLRDLLSAPDAVQAFLSSHAENVRRIALRFAAARNALYLGRGTGYPLALEGALKLKEISYIQAEGCHAAEMKHGPIALIDEQMPVVVLALPGRRYEKTRNNIEEVRARGGRIVAVAAENDREIKDLAEEVIYLKMDSNIINSIVAAVPLQLFAYHIAAARGLNVDQPRNLAKSVTVE